MVSVDVVAGGVIVVGRNVGVRPVGADAVRSTGLLNPLSAATVIVEVLEPPAVIVREVGLADRVKSGPTTFTSTVVVL
jgi:hypothetical protein